MLRFDDNEWLRAIAFATVLFSTIGIFWFSLANPIDHWDMLGYAASLLSLGDMNTVDLHAAVFNEMQEFTTEAQFESLIGSTPYRVTMYEDAEAFSQQIPFFKIRIIFLWLLYVMTATGLGTFESMHLLSAGFGSASLFLTYFGFRKHIHSIFWIISPYLFYEFSQSLYVTRSGGVDSFSFFWIALTCIAYVRYRSILLPMLTLSVLVRTDLILFVAILFLLLFLEDRSSWRRLLVWSSATLMCYVGINNWAGNYGWNTVIHYVFVSDMLATHPETYSSYRISLTQYLDFLLYPKYWINKWFWVGLGSATGAFSIYHFSIGWQSLKGSTTKHQLQRIVIIGTVCLMYSLLHYFLFPAVFMRFFFGQCFLMSIAMMSVLSFILSRRYAVSSVMR